MNEFMTLKPLITEKTLQFAGRGWYTFVVPVSANKPVIAQAISQAYKVTVTDVRTMRMPGKTRRAGKKMQSRHTSDWKKAIVALASNQTIDAFQVTGQPGK